MDTGDHHIKHADTTASAPITPTKEDVKETKEPFGTVPVEPPPAVATAATTASVATVASKTAEDNELGPRIRPIEQAQVYWSTLRGHFYEGFKKFNESIGLYADEITNNYQKYLIVLFVAVIVLALLQTLLFGICVPFIQQIVKIFSRNLTGGEGEGNCPGGEAVINPSKVITFKALKDYVKEARKSGTNGVTILELYQKTVPKGIIGFNFIWKFFSIDFWVNWERNVFSSFFSLITYTLALFTGLWTVLEIVQPLLNLWTTLNVDVLINENKRREEREKNHRNKSFVQTCVVGWNIFERFFDQKLNKERYSLIMPTETTFDLAEFLHDDPILYEKLKKNIDSAIPATTNADPHCPDFLVVLDVREDQADFVRRISNRVSETVKSSQFPGYAQRRKADPNHFENALFVVTCEKDPRVPTRHTRVWLIFPSELKLLLNYSLEEINDKNGPFFVEKDHWRIRIENLYLWAKAEFDPVTKERNANNKYQSQSILLPLG